LDVLRTSPLPGQAPIGVLPLMDWLPSTFTVPFGDRGLLTYAVMRDMPVVKLLDLVWT